MRVIVAEDELLFQEFTTQCLRDEGYEVVAVDTGAALSARLQGGSFDLVLLDLGLPDEDGLVLLRRLRTWSDLPVIVLTGRLDEETRLACLEVGADDYVLKNASRQELLLRVRNLLRRSRNAAAPAEKDRNVIVFDGWRLDLSAHMLFDDGDGDVGLTPQELRVLAILAQAPNRVLSRGQILDALNTGPEPPTERMVDAFISRIRSKMGPGCPIQTVTGVGYRLAAAVRHS